MIAEVITVRRKCGDGCNKDIVMRIDNPKIEAQANSGRSAFTREQKKEEG